MSGSSACASGLILPSLVARDHEAAAWCDVVDRRQPVALVAHMLVVLVAQADVEGEVAPNPPVVLREQMQPVRPPVLVAPSVAGHGRCRVTEQEIRKGVSTELPRVGEGTSRAVRLLGSELQMKVVGANFQPMRASIES